MSGDVQPRKRKDKRRKRDSLDRKSEGDLVFSRRESLQPEEDEIIHHGVHSTKMGIDDVHLHIQNDHGTGGNVCAKLLFFSLMAILCGLVGLIIIENRGSSDLDTPLKESRFSEYFEGWVDEVRDVHDDHDIVSHEIDEHDLHDQPFEEVDETNEDHDDDDDDEDHAHGDEEEDDDDDHGHDDEEEDDENEVSNELDNDNDEDHGTQENDDDDDDNDETNEDDDNEDDNDDEVDEPILIRHRREASHTNRVVNDDDDDDDDNDQMSNENNMNDDDDDDNENSKDNDDDDEDDNDDDDEIQKSEENCENEDDDDDDNNNDSKNDDDDDEQNSNENVQTKVNHESDDDDDDDDDDMKDNDDDDDDDDNNNSKDHNDDDDDDNNNSKDHDDDDPFEEEEDDGTFESLEAHLVDNDAEELQLLQRKAEEAARKDAPKEDDEESTSSPLLVKIIVGVALALVARLVLIKKRPEDDIRNEKKQQEISIIEEMQMKRRLTLTEPIDDTEEIEIRNVEYCAEDEPYSDDMIEEEVEEEEAEDDEVIVEPPKMSAKVVNNMAEIKQQNNNEYIPETFEQLNAMYRPTNIMPLQNTDPKLQVDIKFQTTRTIEYQPRIDEDTTKIVEKFPSMPVPSTKPELQESVKNLYDDKIELPTSLSSQSQQKQNEPIEKRPVMAQLQNKDDDFDEDDNAEDYSPEEDAYEEEEDEEEEEEEDGEEEEEDASDIDDDDLMKRLDAKYGKLPAGSESDNEDDEDEDASWTTEIKRRGPQSYSDDDLIEDDLNRAKDYMRRNNYKAALKIYESLASKYPDSLDALFGKAQSLDHLADVYESNDILLEALESYKRFLAFNEQIPDELFIQAAQQSIERMKFLGLYEQAIPIHQYMIERFNNEPKYWNNLAVTYLSIPRLQEAKSLLEKILKRWPLNGFAQVHYGFTLKALNFPLKDAVYYLQNGIESGDDGTEDGRFYFNLGDALMRLNQIDEARKVYRKGAEKKLFLSEYQRSIYNVNDLKSKPFWTKEETGYENFLNILEDNWQQIRDEGIGAMTENGYFIDENESLKDVGNWKQFELFARGYRKLKNCEKSPVTCKLIEIFPAARKCKRGQTKFSVMHPGTHVWPHCGPTNCRLRAHLGLKIPSGTKIRVAEEERTWEEGKFLIFDDSFEHEVWHNGTSSRLVLIVDVWHPDLTEQQRNSLTPI